MRNLNAQTIYGCATYTELQKQNGTELTGNMTPDMAPLKKVSSARPTSIENEQ